MAEWAAEAVARGKKEATEPKVIQLIKILFFITFVLSAFVSLSAVYVLGLDRSIEIAQYAYKQSIAKTITHVTTPTPTAMTISETFDAIDRETLSLLAEIETQSLRIDFNPIDFLPSPIAIVELPKLTDTLALFFDKSILTTPAINQPLETNAAQPKPIIAQKSPKQEERVLSNKVHIKVNLSTQRMRVYRDNKLLYHWKVSTGRKGYSTPIGQYKPQYLTKMHYSRKYNNSPMPYSIFFRGGYACHGTTSEWRLGQRASHGCIRLKTTNAKTLFHLVQNVGKEKSTIDIKY